MVETFSYPCEGPTIEETPLAQIVALNFYPQENLVVQCLKKNPLLAHTPLERQEFQRKYAFSAYETYMRNLAERRNGESFSIQEARGINAGALIFNPTREYTLWVVKNFNGRRALDIPAGASRRIGEKVNLYHTALREGLGEEAVLISNGELILPEREPDYALQELKLNLERAKRAGLLETKAQMLKRAINRKNQPLNGQDLSLIKAQDKLPLTTVKTIYPDQSYSKENGVFVLHQEGADLLYPFVLPVSAKELKVADLECVLRNGRETALNRNHVWLGRHDLTNLLEGQSIEARFIGENGKARIIIPEDYPFCSLGKETARLLID